jgi:hypothetical protein
MAYKNKKKNAKHQAEIRKSNRWRKNDRKRQRFELKHPRETEREAMLRIGRQVGII